MHLDLITEGLSSAVKPLEQASRMTTLRYPNPSYYLKSKYNSYSIETSEGASVAERKVS